MWPRRAAGQPLTLGFRCSFPIEELVHSPVSMARLRLHATLATRLQIVAPSLDAPCTDSRAPEALAQDVPISHDARGVRQVSAAVGMSLRVDGDAYQVDQAAAVGHGPKAAPSTAMVAIPAAMSSASAIAVASTRIQAGWSRSS